MIKVPFSVNPIWNADPSDIADRRNDCGKVPKQRTKHKTAYGIHSNETDQRVIGIRNKKQQGKENGLQKEKDDDGKPDG